MPLRKEGKVGEGCPQIRMTSFVFHTIGPSCLRFESSEKMPFITRTNLHFCISKGTSRSIWKGRSLYLGTHFHQTARSQTKGQLIPHTHTALKLS